MISFRKTTPHTLTWKPTGNTKYPGKAETKPAYSEVWQGYVDK